MFEPCFKTRIQTRRCIANVKKQTRRDDYMDTVDMIIRSSTSFYNDLKQDKMVDIVRGNIVIQTFSCFV